MLIFLRGAVLRVDRVGFHGAALQRRYSKYLEIEQKYWLKMRAFFAFLI